MAITTQVRDGLRRERRVAEDVSAAIVAAVRLARKDKKAFTTETLRNMPALSSVASDLLRDEILSLTSGTESPDSEEAPIEPAVPPADPKVVEQAANLAALLVKNGAKKLTDAEAKKFPELLAALTEAQRGEIVA